MTSIVGSGDAVTVSHNAKRRCMFIRGPD